MGPGGSTKGREFDLSCPMASAEHDCEWKERHEALASQHRALADTLSGLQHEFEKLKRQLLGPKSEKMPRVSDELRAGKKADRNEITRKRRERTEARAQKLEQQTTVHPVAAAQRKCPKCGCEELRTLGTGKESVVYEYVPARFVEVGSRFLGRQLSGARQVDLRFS